MAANATESDLSSLTSTKTVFHGDAIRSTASFSSELSSSQHSSTALLSGSSATLHNDVPSTSILQDSLASSHSAFSTVYHASSQSVSSTSQPLSTSATPPLTSVKEPYETSNYKISSHSSSPVKSSGIDSVQLTSNISPSSSVIYPSSSYIPPLLPITTAATNGSVSSTPSSLTDNLTLILGMSLCGVGLLILLIIVLFVCCKKRSTTKQQTVETVQIGDLWASNRGDISYAPTFDSVLDTVSESPKVQNKTSKDVLYHVLYPYTAQDDSQLNLDLGDVVTLVEKRGNGWWKGRIKDKEGWFPGSYVEETGIGKVYTSNHHLLNGHSPSLGKEVSIPKVPTPTSSPYQSPPASKPTSPSHIPHSYGKVITENVGRSTSKPTSSSHIPHSYGKVITENVGKSTSKPTSPCHIPHSYGTVNTYNVGKSTSKPTSPSHIPHSYGTVNTYNVGKSTSKLNSPSHIPASHGKVITGKSTSNLTSPSHIPASHGMVITGKSTSNLTSPSHIPASHGMVITGKSTSNLTSPSHIPASHGQVITGKSTSNLTSPSHIPASHGQVITGGRRFYALYSHEPNFSNELQLDVGDVVIGIERDEMVG
ncbi:SH3PXD2 [Mytilus coruscus]|uniref:SH3PXD2 n=1 Tax=Mytilus coruscus TaxID=42192 RepID=A0A6J8AVE0_MYTCO|nr:SH3PXD2 [Mytilus coruscus]